jgi:hypothetical protein
MIAPATIAMPYVRVRARCSDSSRRGRSWAGSARGGGACTNRGGRQPAGGGVVGGGPEYGADVRVGGGTGGGGEGEPSVGRRHCASSSSATGPDRPAEPCGPDLSNGLVLLTRPTLPRPRCSLLGVVSEQLPQRDGNGGLLGPARRRRVGWCLALLGGRVGRGAVRSRVLDTHGASLLWADCSQCEGTPPSMGAPICATSTPPRRARGITLRTCHTEPMTWTSRPPLLMTGERSPSPTTS